MSTLASSISTLLRVAISMAVVASALAETRTARNGEAVIEYQIDGKGPAVLMIVAHGFRDDRAITPSFPFGLA
jgi:hypothetical protein